MKITEIYFKSSESKKNEQWFEVFNSTEKSVNLKNAQIRKIDGKKNPKQAWSVFLPDQDWILEPGQFAVIAQQADLGQNLCSEYKIIVVQDKNFSFASKGVQTLCVKPSEEEEFCAPISNSKKVESNYSRYLVSGTWFEEKIETCEIKPGVFASPGLPELFCQKNLESGWSVCPEKLLETTTQKTTASCQMVSQKPDSALELAALFIGWILFKRLFLTSAATRR